MAARPWLYPRHALGDTDIKARLQSLGQAEQRSKPSLKASFMRKVLSNCVDYEEDFPLVCLLHDIALARQISSVVNIAQAKGIAPEQAASHMQNFDQCWKQEQEKLEDMCRQHNMLPNVFATVAPAEWRARKAGARRREVYQTGRRS